MDVECVQIVVSTYTVVRTVEVVDSVLRSQRSISITIWTNKRSTVGRSTKQKIVKKKNTHTHRN